MFRGHFLCLQLFASCWDLLYGLAYGQFWLMFCVYLKITVLLLLASTCSVLYLSISPRVLFVLFRSTFFLLIFLLVYIGYWERHVTITDYLLLLYTVDYFSLYWCQFIFHTLVKLCNWVHINKCSIFFLSCEMSFFISTNVSCLLWY